MPGAVFGNSASGEKLRKTVYFTDGISVVKDYIGSFVYVDGVLDFFHTSEGRVEYDGTNFEYQYSIKDHLGNVRVLFADDGAGNAIIKQENHYYPYGLTLAGLGSTGGSDNKFLYNGKELEDEHNLYWYHYGARYYDPQLGLWHSIDPADEFYSPYVYVKNSPISFVDPDGKEITIAYALWTYKNQETDWNFKEYAANSKAFKTFVALFGKGGPLEEQKVRWDFTNNPKLRGQTLLFHNGEPVTYQSPNTIIAKTGISGYVHSWLMEKEGKYSQEVRLNPSHELFNKDGYETADHEIGHVAFNAIFILRNASTKEDIYIIIGGDQDKVSYLSGKAGTYFIYSAKELRDLLKKHYGLESDEELDNFIENIDIEQKITIEEK